MGVVDEPSAIESHRVVVLTTPRLSLTSWLSEDVEPLHEIHSDPRTMEHVRQGRPESRTEVERLVDRYIAEHAANGLTKWRLVDRNGTLVGRAGFSGTRESRELGYVIRRDMWGLGLATEVAEALVNWHLSRSPGVPLRALVAVGNDASVRVLEKVGFQESGREDYEGTICRAFMHPDAV